MGVPKRRVSTARQGDRRSHHAISTPTLEECTHCHASKLAHHVCPTCGYYRGRPAVDLKTATSTPTTDEPAS
jgi:large subunit ribosomal protein L32